MLLIFSSCFPTGATEKHELLKVDSRNATTDDPLHQTNNHWAKAVIFLLFLMSWIQTPTFPSRIAFALEAPSKGLGLHGYAHVSFLVLFNVPPLVLLVTTSIRRSRHLPILPTWNFS